ncbi:uncharacterized protein LOC131688184 [Topomyia yanbarensis]|uniref:uncharacterized protein LOC131688184 n=1 Tax=Topomyia yanbarensis TaxID=2498891 RepID=UPI00273CE702|nr:uncharacterized protein LOC131688184 [Topomyia yanbarensis]
MSGTESEVSDCSSIPDPDTVYLEDDIPYDGTEEELFSSNMEDFGEDSDTYMSKCGTVKWDKYPPKNMVVCDDDFECSFSIDFSAVKTPKDAFRLFFDDSIVADICMYTNAEGSYDPSFAAITHDELLAWIAIVIAAGKNHDGKTHIKEMWSTDEVTRRLFYSAVMGRRKIDKKPEKNQGKRVVTQLVQPFANSTGPPKRRVTFDNFFTSVQLVDDLFANGFYSIGTLRSNKKEIPKEFLKQRSIAPGTVKFGFNDKKMLVSWTEKRNKTVLLLSTDPSAMPSCDMIKNNIENLLKPQGKPKVVHLYNSLKGGVDTLDKSTGSYSCKRRSNRYTVAIFYNLLDIANHDASFFGLVI